MEASAIRHLGAAGAHGRSPLLRLQSDERLVGLVRRGNHNAFEALVSRYESRLLAFCRHMLSSQEDAEDVLQEVFAAAFHAMLADDRPINVRPWLYRIARNRSLNHLRRIQPVGVDSMDTHFAEYGLSTAEKAHRREDFRLLIADVQELPEAQRTALLLREIDALSYEQIAEAMENTVPSVKSLLVRARVGLAEAAEARLLDCELVRFELGEVAEGLKRISAPVRRHVRTCEQCAQFRRQLADTNRQLAALLPVGPLLILKKMLLAQLGSAAASGGGSAAAGTAAGGALQLSLNAAAGKAAAGIAAAAIVTAGAVEAKHVAIDHGGRPAVVVRASAPVPAPASAPVPASDSTRSGQLTPTAPGLDPFAAGGAPMVAAVGGEGSAPADKALGQPGADGATGDGALAGEEPGTAKDPLLMADVPGVLGAPADSLGGPLNTPVGAPANSPALIEGVVRPADAASGTPVTGIVGPGTAGKQDQPIVEVLEPAEDFSGNGTPVSSEDEESIEATEQTGARPRVPVESAAPSAPTPARDEPVPAQQPQEAPAADGPDTFDGSGAPVAGDDDPAPADVPAVTGQGAPTPAVTREDASESSAGAQDPSAG